MCTINLNCKKFTSKSPSVMQIDHIHSLCFFLTRCLFWHKSEILFQKCLFLTRCLFLIVRFQISEKKHRVKKEGVQAYGKIELYPTKGRIIKMVNKSFCFADQFCFKNLLKGLKACKGLSIISHRTEQKNEHRSPYSDNSLKQILFFVFYIVKELKSLICRNYGILNGNFKKCG